MRTAREPTQGLLLALAHGPNFVRFFVYFLGIASYVFRLKPSRQAGDAACAHHGTTGSAATLGVRSGVQWMEWLEGPLAFFQLQAPEVESSPQQKQCCEK